MMIHGDGVYVGKFILRRNAAYRPSAGKLAMPAARMLARNRSAAAASSEAWLKKIALLDSFMKLYLKYAEAQYTV